MELKKIPTSIINEFPIIGEFIGVACKDEGLTNCINGEGFSFLQNTVNEFSKLLSSSKELEQEYEVNEFTFNKITDLQTDFFDSFNRINYVKGEQFYTFDGREYGTIKDTSRDMFIAHFNATVAVYTVSKSGIAQNIFIIVQEGGDNTFSAHSSLFKYEANDENGNPLDLFVFGSDTRDKGVNRYRIIRFNQKTHYFSPPCAAYLTQDTSREGYTFINNIGDASLVPLHKGDLYATINNRISKWDILIDTYKDNNKEERVNRFLYTSTKGNDEMYAGFTTPSGKTYVIFEITMNTGYINFKASLVDGLESIPSFFYKYKHEVRYYSYKIEDIRENNIDLTPDDNNTFPRDIVNVEDIQKVVEMFTAFNNFETFADLLATSERVSNQNGNYIYHWDHLATDTAVFSSIITERGKYEKV